MMLRVALFSLECLFSGVFLWLGLYLITRDHPNRAIKLWQRSALSMGIALLFAAVYLLGIAMELILEGPSRIVTWQRLTGWAVSLAVSTTFHGMLLVTDHEQRSANRRRAGYAVSLLLLICAACMAVLASATNLFNQYEAVQRIPWEPNYFQIPPRYPYYAFGVIFIIGTLLGSTILPIRRYFVLRGEARRQFRWIAAAAGLLVLGATVGNGGELFPRLNIPPELGDLILVVGIALLGYGVAHYNAFFQHQIITRDFYRSLVGAGITSGIFLLLFTGVHRLTDVTPTFESIPLLVWLAVLTVTLGPWLNERLDEIFFSRAAVIVRRTLNHASERLAITEDEQEALHAIEAEVPRAITATLADLKLQELRAAIGRDINDLFRGTNYARHSGEQYVAIATDLLKLAVVEERTEAIMAEDGVATMLDRQPYQLKAFEQIIDGLVLQMEAEAAAMKGVHEDINSYRRQRKEAQATILRMQFLRGIPRERVQAHIETKLQVGKGGSYGRFLTAAKGDLAERLYLAELRALSAREERLSA
jgi:drug/metabolite transporter (DMT)-like permease